MGPLVGTGQALWWKPAEGYLDGLGLRVLGFTLKGYLFYRLRLRSSRAQHAKASRQAVELNLSLALPSFGARAFALGRARMAYRMCMRPSARLGFRV